MASSYVRTLLRINDEYAFFSMMREVVFDLVNQLTAMHVTSEVILRITKLVLADYFHTTASYEQFMDKLDFTKKTTYMVMQFARSFHTDEFIAIYHPYNEAKWDEFYTDLVHGVKRRIIELQYLVNQFVVPELKLPDAPIPRVEKSVERLESFPDKMREYLHCIGMSLDEDYIESKLRGRFQDA